ncbi:hypothetical protein NMY22_g9433 [Coprinellus aureogranulatus]|nr:hypothetical protein NMY22_g9433 [Coprinellus aureogranulatus]
MASENDGHALWLRYTGVVHSSGSAALPLKLHQEVLRKCSPTAHAVRAASSGQEYDGGSLAARSHNYEARYQTIMGNIRTGGYTPSLDDYHFLLSQCVAVGNVPQSLELYRELQSTGNTPTEKTFGLIFQVIAFRLTVPMRKNARGGLLEEVQTIFNGLLDDMKRLNIQFADPTTIELSFRILSSTMDYSSFEQFMKWAYSIDMSHPNCVALDRGEDESGTRMSFRFSTAALNTVIFFLGRTGNLSKMTQAFAALTPSLRYAHQHFLSSPEVDEAGALLSSGHSQPRAQPDTSTYRLLIRYSTLAGHATLALHYLDQAIWLNSQICRSLRETWLNKALISRPPFRLQALHFAPVFKLCLKTNKSGLLRSLNGRLAQQVKLKEVELSWWQAELTNYQQHPTKPVASDEAKIWPPSSASKETQRTDALTSTPSTMHTPRCDVSNDFDVFLKPKPFDIVNHIQGLYCDISELEELKMELGRALRRKRQPEPLRSAPSACLQDSLLRRPEYKRSVILKRKTAGPSVVDAGAGRKRN